MLYSKSKREVIHPRMCNTSTFSVPSNRKSYVITAHKCSSQLNLKRKFAQFHQVNLLRQINKIIVTDVIYVKNRSRSKIKVMKYDFFT